MSCYYQYSFQEREDPGAQAKMKEYWDAGVRGYGWGVWKCECIHCQQVFYAKTPVAKWCSCKCGNDAYVASQKQRREKARHRVCLECSEPFIGSRNDAKYCSHTCRQIAYKKRLTDNALTQIETLAYPSTQ